MKAYIVTGFYSFPWERHIWIVKGFTTPEAAMDFTDTLNHEAQWIFLHFNRDAILANQATSKYDPNMEHGDSAALYSWQAIDIEE